MDIFEALILVVSGLIAGFINVTAGGGSLLTLPVMIFLGLPPAVANGSNRIAILVQNIFAIRGFQSKGVSAWPYSLWLGISALLGAILGAKISVELDGQVFNRILSIVMLLVMGITIFNPLKGGKDKVERMDPKHKAIAIVTFFFVGIYGGFIQAGVGFLIIAALSMINKMWLVKINSAKVTIILIYTLATLAVFAIEGKLNILWGLTLAVGNATGAWIGSRWQVDKGEVWVRRILLVMVVAMSIKLWFF